MMKFVLASSNQKKIKELRAILSQIMEDAEVITLAEAGITDDIVEDGASFAENAFIKARVAASTGNIGIADDSGLTVEALGDHATARLPSRGWFRSQRPPS